MNGDKWMDAWGLLHVVHSQYMGVIALSPPLSLSLSHNFFSNYFSILLTLFRILVVVVVIIAAIILLVTIPKKKRNPFIGR
jgi:hypothetical protein